MNTEQIKKLIEGAWISVATELRPSAKDIDGKIKPFYLTRIFKFNSDDTFELVIINSADAFGKITLARIGIKGHMVWQGDHPIAPGAQKVKFIANEAYEITPLNQGFADAMNKSASNGYSEWKVNAKQSILKKTFAPFGLKEGEIFSEYDLIYLLNDLLFWGARNLDGTPFDSEENRPTNLQIPLVRHK